MMKLHDTRLRPAIRSVEWWGRCCPVAKWLPSLSKAQSRSHRHSKQASKQASKCGLSVVHDAVPTSLAPSHREIAGRAFPTLRPQSPKHTSHLCTEEGAGRRTSHPSAASASASASDCCILLLPFMSLSLGMSFTSDLGDFSPVQLTRLKWAVVELNQTLPSSHRPPV